MRNLSLLIKSQLPQVVSLAVPAKTGIVLHTYLFIQISVLNWIYHIVVNATTFSVLSFIQAFGATYP